MSLELLPLSEGRVEGVGFPCGCKMAASVQLEVRGEEAPPDVSVTFVRKSSSLSRNPQHTSCFVSLAESVTWPPLAESEAAT